MGQTFDKIVRVIDEACRNKKNAEKARLYSLQALVNSLPLIALDRDLLIEYLDLPEIKTEKSVLPFDSFIFELEGLVVMVFPATEEGRDMLSINALIDNMIQLIPFNLQENSLFFHYYSGNPEPCIDVILNTIYVEDASNKKEVFRFVDGREKHMERMTRNAQITGDLTITVMGLLTHPTNFIYQSTGVPSLKRKTNKFHTPRTAERDIYTIIHVGGTKIINKNLPSGEPGAKKAPHPRRRHIRTLNHEIYAKTGNQGKQIVVSACWVGDETMEIKGRKYKVMLDK